MQFKDEALDSILDTAEGVAPSTFAPILRQQLSARDKARKAAKLAGISMTAVRNANLGRYFVVGAVFEREGWKMWPEVWEIEGLAMASDALNAVCAWGLPDAPAAELADQMNAAYIMLGRRGYADFQTVKSPSEFATVYAFKSHSEALSFRVMDIEKRPKPKGDVAGLVRK
jgi:hypothetical protein